MLSLVGWPSRLLCRDFPGRSAGGAPFPSPEIVFVMQFLLVQVRTSDTQKTNLAACSAFLQLAVNGCVCF